MTKAEAIKTARDIGEDLAATGRARSQCDRYARCYTYWKDAMTALGSIVATSLMLDAYDQEWNNRHGF